MRGLFLWQVSALHTFDEAACQESTTPAAAEAHVSYNAKTRGLADAGRAGPWYACVQAATPPQSDT